MTDFQLLARGIALAGCGIGAGLALIAGIGPGIGEGNAAIWNSWSWLRKPGSQPNTTWLRLASAQYSRVEMTVPDRILPK